MSRLLRLALAGVLCAVSVVGLGAGVAEAGAGASASTAVVSPVTVGQTGTFSMTLRNENETVAGEPLAYGDLTNTVCNRIPQPGTNCSTDIEGITYTPSCGRTGQFSVCSAPDPNVFEISSPATGTGGECVGTVFDVNPLNDVDGRYLFTPQAGGSVVLPGEGAECTISFQYRVLKLPTVDADPTRAGFQTIAIADNTQSVENTPNTASGRGQSFPLTVQRATPFINTVASPGGALGATTLTDTAVLSGRQFPTDGTVTFRLYGPDDDTCAGTPVFVDANRPYPTSPANGAQLVSAPYTPTSVGTYRWVATYNGDTNNAPVTGVCGDPAETVDVAPAVTSITTEASADRALGTGALTDTATVSGVVNPQAGATVTFSLYGPDDDDCAAAPVFTSTVAYPVSGGAVTSQPYTPTTAGTYQWVAVYSGDRNNLGAEGDCGDPDEITEVAPATPAITTDASDGNVVGDRLTDVATVTGRVNPLDSTIDFRLYGPGDTDCSGTPVFTSLGVPLAAGATTATSAPYTVTAPGTYRWVATYNGDVNNEPATGVCGDPAETVRVFASEARIVTRASSNTFLGDGTPLTDVATVLDRTDPDDSAVIDFRLYGPNDATCSGNPVFESLGIPYPAAGGSVTSAAFTPTVAGTYRWVATYSGDENNLEAVGVCGDPAETVTVAPTPDIDTELPATGPGATTPTLLAGLGSLLAGLVLLGASRRRLPLGR